MARVQPDGAQGTQVERDILDAPGRTWGKDALRDFLALLHSADTSILARDDFTTFLQNHKLGVD